MKDSMSMDSLGVLLLGWLWAVWAAPQVGQESRKKMIAASHFDNLSIVCLMFSSLISSANRQISSARLRRCSGLLIESARIVSATITKRQAPAIGPSGWGLGLEMKRHET
jgi:hypothetical protein